MKIKPMKIDSFDELINRIDYITDLGYLKLIDPLHPESIQQIKAHEEECLKRISAEAVERSMEN